MFLENIHFLNYWMPYKEGAVYLHALAPMFHIIDFPLGSRLGRSAHTR